MSKCKKLIVLISALVAIASAAAAVALFVYNIFGAKKNATNYIECECEPDYT